MERAIDEPEEIQRLDSRASYRPIKGKHIAISGPFNAHPQRDRPSIPSAYSHHSGMTPRRRSSISVLPPVRKRATIRDALKRKEKKLVVLRDQKDRFDAMRRIQHSTARFKRWYALTLSLIAFSLLWCVGAIVFWQCEKNAQGMTYFQALYLCYVSLLTIGYGDLAPQSNAGRCFFVIWSLIAVPTITILINDLGGTVIDSFKKGTFRFADFTILPKEGVWKDWLQSKPKLWKWLLRRKEKREQKKRLKEGLQYPSANDTADLENAEDSAALHPDLDTLSKELTDDKKHQVPSDAILARRLALAIRQVAIDLKSADADTKYYTFEEWAELTRLIRFTSQGDDAAIAEEKEDGLIEWDWIGETSPMMSGQNEPEFVLDRLCESLGRYMRRVERYKERTAGKEADLECDKGADGFHCHDGIFGDPWQQSAGEKAGENSGSSGSSSPQNSEKSGKVEKQGKDGADHGGKDSKKGKRRKRRHSG
jgi:potassium channel subfamily K